MHFPPCLGAGEQIINGSVQSSSGVILLQNFTVCVAGLNEIVYDIGTLDTNGVFVPSVIGVYKMEITVVEGPAALIRMVLLKSTVQHTYSLISSALGVILQDQGQNVIVLFCVPFMDNLFLCIQLIYRTL
jgi:hypothetical protein